MNQNLKQIKEIRAFNREYTNIIGLMNKHLLDSDYTLQEMRILFEINAIAECTSKDLKKKIDIDGGYLSRVLKNLVKRGLINRQLSADDLRVHYFELTPLGHQALSAQEDASDHHINNLISHLTDHEKNKIVDSMKTILRHIDKSKKTQESLDGIKIRENLRPGDLGYLTYLHAKIYNEECNYDLEFEGYVCQTFSDFANRYSPDLDRFFIAEKEGVIVGNIAILGHSKEEAQLRWFLINPELRGLGLGQDLLRRALEFCEEKGYKKIWLLTTTDQKKASSMYKNAGFKLVKETPVKAWGRDLVEEKYELSKI